MKKKILFLLLLLASVLVYVVYSNFYSQKTERKADADGKVVGIADGDTFTLLTPDNTQVKIRLQGVDCPEKKQAFGERAKQYTSEQIFGKNIHIEVKETDRYGRKIAIAYIDDSTSLNEMLLKKGLAWHYTHYDQSQKYTDLETQARRNKVGLWADPNPIAPWDFRKGGVERKSTPTEKTATQRCQGITKKGTQCKKNAVNKGLYCKQHEAI